MAKRGFHATSTTELCEANELGKGALYYYIGSKEELLAAIHDRVMDEVLATAEAVLAEEATPVEHSPGWAPPCFRHHQPLPRSRLGVPARVPGAHR